MRESLDETIDRVASAMAPAYSADASFVDALRSRLDESRHRSTRWAVAGCTMAAIVLAVAFTQPKVPVSSGFANAELRSTSTVGNAVQAGAAVTMATPRGEAVARVKAHINVNADGNAGAHTNATSGVPPGSTVGGESALPALQVPELRLEPLLLVAAAVDPLEDVSTLEIVGLDDRAESKEPR